MLGIHCILVICTFCHSSLCNHIINVYIIYIYIYRTQRQLKEESEQLLNYKSEIDKLVRLVSMNFIFLPF